MKTQKQIPVTSYKASGFTEKYQNIVHSTVIPYQYSVLWDKADGAEKSHVAANFINAAKALRGEDPDRKSTRLNSSHPSSSRMPSSA